MINLLLVDDHKIIRDGIKALLKDTEEVRIVDECSDGDQVLDMLEKQKEIDIILMDINMSGMNGMEATEKVLEKHPNTKVIALTMYNEESYISKMLQIGAVGYILKNTGKSELVEAIKKVDSGDTYFSSDATHQMMSRFMKPSGGDKGKKDYGSHISANDLTEREKEVLRLIASEFTNQEIADQLKISNRTVDAHRRNLLQKTGVKNTAGLVRFALENKLVETDSF